MNKFELAAKTTLGAFLVLIVLAFVVLSLQPVEGSLIFHVVQTLSLIIALLFFLPGFYLWVTGFNRFKKHLGYWKPRMFLYLVFTIFYAVYIQLRYGNEIQNNL